MEGKKEGQARKGGGGGPEEEGEWEWNITDGERMREGGLEDAVPSQ